MTQHRTFGGNSLDEVLSKACEALQARVGELHYEVVESTEEKVAISAMLDPIAMLGLFLSEMFAAGEIKVAAYLENDGDVLIGELSGEDLGLLTAGGGKGLDALQYLCNRVLNRRLEENQPVHLDADGFKQRRADRLSGQALSTAQEVERSGKPIVLGPLTPAARREVHLALADHPRVETESEGDGFIKRVVVRPRRRR